MLYKKKDELSHVSLFGIWLVAIVVFSIIYWLLSYIPGHGPTQLNGISDPLMRFFDALYFSVITGATVGYGDILPLGISKIFAAFEGILSFVLLAVFVSRLSSRKHDAALTRIHAISADTAFNDIRHGLFVSRKDLDLVIKKLASTHALEEKDWKNLRTALRQMQIFIRRISELRETKHHTSFLDTDHEQLIFDSVERSLRRVVETAQELEISGLSCVDNTTCGVELAGIYAVAEKEFVLTPHTKNQENEELYQEVVTQLTLIRGLLSR
ncbi:MAG: potassium channel family protein [Patescibacteria group bacterium]